VRMTGGELQLLAVVTWSLVYGLDFLLGALALERGTLPWLAIGSSVCFQNYSSLSRLRCSGVALCLWLGDNIVILSMVKMSTPIILTPLEELH
jgi:hypothetical protein